MAPVAGGEAAGKHGHGKTGPLAGQRMPVSPIRSGSPGMVARPPWRPWRSRNKRCSNLFWIASGFSPRTDGCELLDRFELNTFRIAAVPHVHLKDRAAGVIGIRRSRRCAPGSGVLPRGHLDGARRPDHRDRAIRLPRHLRRHSAQQRTLERALPRAQQYLIDPVLLGVGHDRRCRVGRLKHMVGTRASRSFNGCAQCLSTTSRFTCLLWPSSSSTVSLAM